MGSGKSFDFALLCVAGFIVGIASLVIAAFYYWSLPLWQSVLAAFGIGALLVTAFFGIMGLLQEREWKGVLMEMNMGFWIWTALVSIAGAIFWLFSFLYSLF